MALVGTHAKKSANELPYWVIEKPIISDNNDFATSTMTRNHKQCMWCNSCNNVQGVWGFHWKDGHEEWKNKQVKKLSLRFSNTTTNRVTYCSYLMTTSEEPMEEEEKGWDNSQNNYFISLSCV